MRRRSWTNAQTSFRQGHHSLPSNLLPGNFAMASMVMPLQSRDHWSNGLMLNNRGGPLGNLRNVLHALRKAPEWHGVLAYDVFAARTITTKPPPWSDEALEWWMDYHDFRACEWFQEQGIPVTVGMVGRGIQVVAGENPYIPCVITLKP
jgi:hypothetical protein